jgi:uncharacterized membrane protein YgdD (TMEM256/DUF423 family)
LLAVILGAAGAHALEQRLAGHGTAAAWETAVDYHFGHAVAMAALAAARAAGLVGVGTAFWTGTFWEVGIVCFSGSLYWLALDGPGWLGPVTPLGGVLFLAGWALLFARALREAFRGAGEDGPSAMPTGNGRGLPDA